MNNFKTIEASGLPRPVPQHDAQNDNAESELEHGSHGVQGGEKGNEYQALWMTLACINAIHQPNTEPVRLSKIILEGSREPFDDIEIVKSDGSLTLFQSKHRHKAGSNNILISELVKIPGGKDSAPFSLLKYFKGMMSIKANSGFNDIRFIIGVSAPFSESFELPSKKNEKRECLI
ncbi:MAG: hypothetical protein HWD59_04520 [Coxiellaceae bacterium]|nr:MAG: hypothetical protein HWD59_04520 [Coxiellaceae bacterium]